jgi:hypothetical protein
MSSDELKYVVKLEADEKSFAEIQKALEAVEKQARNASKGGKSAGSKSDTEQEVSALKELRQELKLKQESLAEVQKALREGTQTTQEATESQRELTTSIADLRTRVQDATRGYIDQDTAVKGVATTYNQLVEQNRALSIAMREVPLDDTTGELQRLQAQYAQNNVKLKEFDASLGNFQRNVGDYTGGLRGFANSIAIIQGPLGPIAGRINSLATVLERFSKTQKATNDTSTLFGNILKGNIPLLTASASASRAKTTAVMASNVAVKGLNVTLKALRFVLISLGIPALVIGVLALISAFKRTEGGAQQLRVIMASISAVLEVLRDRASALGRVIIEALKDPKQAIIDLGKALIDNIVNRFVAIPKLVMSAFGVIIKGGMAAGEAIRGIWSKEARERSRELFKEAGKDLLAFGDSIGTIFTGIEEPLSKLIDGASELAPQLQAAAQQAAQLQREMNAVLVTERELSLQRAMQNRDLQEARRLARDMDVDSQTRLEALRLIAQEEGKLLEKELDNERERLRIMEEQAKMSDTDEKTKQAIVDQQIKLADLERSSLEKQMSTQRDINTVERQIREERLRQIRTENEMFERTRSHQAQIVRDNLIREGKLAEALQGDLLAFEKNKLDEKKRLEELYFIELRALNFSEAKAKEIAEIKAQQDINEELYKLQTAFDDQVRKDRIDTDKFDRDIALKRTEMLLEFERDRLIRQGRLAEAARLEELHTEEGQQQLLNDLKERYLQEFLDSGLNAEEAARRAQEKAEIESAQRIFDAKRALSDAELEQRLATAKLISDGVGAINKAFFGESKEIAVAKAVVDTYAGAQSAFAETRGGIFTKSAAAATALTMGFANVRKILETKIGSKSTSGTMSSAPKVSSSFGLVDAGTNRQQFAFDTASQAQSMTAQNMQPTIVLEGEFDPAFLAVKVTMGNNQISSQGTGF